MKSFGHVIKRVRLLMLLILMLHITVSPCQAEIESDFDNHNTLCVYFPIHIYGDISFSYADGVLFVNERYYNKYSNSYTKVLSDKESETLFALLDALDPAGLPKLRPETWVEAQKNEYEVALYYGPQAVHFLYGFAGNSAYDDLITYILRIAPADFTAQSEIKILDPK